MKIIRINDCYHCPFSIYSNVEDAWECKRTSKIFREKPTYIPNTLKDNEFPSWCPLEDDEDLEEEI